MQHFSVTIPVKTYVRKYIETRYPQPMVLSIKNLMGTVVYSFLEKEKIKNHTKKDDYYAAIRYGKLTDNVKVLIPKNEVIEYRQGLSLCPIKAILINNLFEEKINEDLHTFCKAYNLAGLSQRQAIEDFAREHNIFLENDITYFSFKKAEYRHKKKLEKNTPKVSPHFN